MKSIFCILLVLSSTIPNIVSRSVDCEEEELASHPFNCNAYLKCDNGLFVEMLCSPGLYFNPEENTCDWSANVDCSPNGQTPPSWQTTTQNSNATTPSTTTQSATPPSVECEEEELASHPFNCNAYLKCDNGLFVEMLCAPGLYFNPEENTCDWSANVDCSPNGQTPPSWQTTTQNSNATTPSTTTQSATPPSVECEEEELASHPFNCNAYLKCDNGLFVEMLCAPGLYFNPEENTCDWSANVDCSPSGQTPPSWQTTTSASRTSGL